MIRYVIDASAASEFLLRTALGLQIARIIEGASLYAPELMDAEVLSVLRKAVLDGSLSNDRAQAAIEDLEIWQVRRISHRHLTRIAWRYRHNLSAYDAYYVAVARAQDAPLITADRRLSRASGLDIDIRIV